MNKVVKALTQSLGVLGIVILVLIGFHSWTNVDAAELTYKPTYSQTEARSMLDRINKFRHSSEAWYWNEDNSEKITCENLSDLVYDYDLEKVAMQRAAEIALYWDHIRPDGRNCWSAYSDCGYSWQITVAENIAAGQSSAEAAFVAWREDDELYSGQGHRRNMLKSNVKAIGIACVTVNGIKFWVQEFAGNTPSAPWIEAADSIQTVNVKVTDSNITLVSVQEEAVSVDVGDSIAIPDVKASIKVSGSWPSGKVFSVSFPNIYDTADGEYVTLSGKNISGVKAGTGAVMGTLLGQSVSLTVTVNGGEPEDPEEPEVYYGDVNDDGKIGAKDVTILRRYITGGWDVDINVDKADLDGDGNVGAKDVTMLRRYLAGGWGVVMPEAPTKEIEINEGNFPDYFFRKYVIENIDLDKNGKLSESELTIERIDVSDQGISNLTGIEHFKNLKYLYCNRNNLTSLNISENTELLELECFNNMIASLNLDNNTSLTVLNCFNNKLKVLDLANNTKLEKIECGFNQISELKLEDLVNLKYLSCHENALNSLCLDSNLKLEKFYCSANQLTLLDLSNNVLLDDIVCERCGLEAIILPESDNLIDFDCGDNKIKSLDFSKHPNIESIYCYDNILSEIDISGCTKLIYFNCSRNNLKEINLNENSSLSWFMCSDNDFTELNLDKCIELNAINCSGNNLKSISVSNNPKLEYLCCSENNISEIDLSYSNALIEFVCTGNNISNFDFSSNNAIEVLDCSDNNITELNVENMAALKSLSCANNYLQRLNIGKNEELEKLDCTDNTIQNIDVSRNCMLTNLLCGYNELRELNITNLKELYYLNCEHNEISELDTRNNLKLGHLYCNNNNLHELDISNNTELWLLHCERNYYLQEVDTTNNVNLYDLFVDEYLVEETPINTTSFPDAALREYISLNFDATGDGILDKDEICNVKEINVSGLNVKDLTGIDIFVWLEKLDFSNTKVVSFTKYGGRLKELNASNNFNLLSLTVASNYLEQIDISGCDCLRQLNCNRNCLKSLDVSSIELNYLSCAENPLEELILGNNDLYSIYVNDCKLKSLDVSGCICLNSLSAENNDIREIDLRNNKEINQNSLYLDEDVHIIWTDDDIILN